ncbi:polysaccharide biosynthesis tyrosine autokinase [Aquisalimonas sp.]|uniref:polysaccharide biosynthesis tyrosine autokinase n=1 Tax=Aquisalimonas sp. TaxID=1872621 RepID=UPI0025BDA226|nr:polysaccharide biosynthesis tyrosine autokinase [Aquisalimonas sp.]
MTDSTAHQHTRGDADEIELGQLVDILRNGKWLIIACTLTAALLGFVHATLSTNIYSGDAILQVDTPRNPIPGLRDLGLTPEGSATSAEMEILRSRLMLGTVVDQLDLTIAAEPRRFPVIGAYLARRHGGDEPAPALFGAEKYGWGGETIELSRLEIGPALRDEELILTALGGNDFRISTATGEFVAEGTVDKPLQVEHNGSTQLAVFVRELTARPGTEFTLRSVSRLDAINGLRRSLSISEQGQESGILSLSMEHADSERIANVLNALTQAYVRQNVERKSEEATRSLEFLEEQLPELRRELQLAEQEFNEFRSSHQAVDLEQDARALLASIVEVEEQLAGLRVETSELRLQYGPDHPRMESVAERRESLNEIKEEIEKQVSALPEKQQQALRLRREMEVSTTLYTGLLNTSQELRVARAGTVGDVRILDEAAVGGSPVRPQRSLILALSVVLGGMLGVMAVFGRAFLRRGVNDPDTLEQQIGKPVYAVVPHSKLQSRAARRAKARKEALMVLARDKPHDPVVESLRSLRTSLTFALMRETRQVLMITSPAPSSGKTFLSINLAWLLAEAGQRVLLIDSDMRRGRLHAYLQGRTREPGLSEVLAGKHTLDEVKISLLDGRLDAVTSGTLPPNPSELLMQERFRTLVADAEAAYDIVIIDTAPVMAVTDASIVGASAGASLLLVRAGVTGERETQATVHRLEQATVNVSGLVLNDFQAGATSAGSYQYYYYDYNYGSEAKA